MLTRILRHLLGSRRPLDAVKRYMLYYGHPSDEAVETIRLADLAILEPHSYSRALIADIQASGTLTIGYISILEAPAWNAVRTSLLQPDDYYLIDGRPLHFPEWDSYMMDLTSPHYRELLLAEIQEQIIAKGFAGIFLDTVADLEEYTKEPSERERLTQAYLNLIQRLKQSYPALLLIQNRGFTFIEEALPWIDGFLWENWDGGWRQNGWMVNNVARMRRLRQRGLRIFTLSVSNDARHERESNALGFVHLAKPNGYNEP